MGDSSPQEGDWWNFVCEAEAFFCVKLVTDLQKHAKMLGREEVAKRIGPLAQIFSGSQLAANEHGTSWYPKISKIVKKCKHVGSWQSTRLSIFFSLHCSSSSATKGHIPAQIPPVEGGYGCGLSQVSKHACSSKASSHRTGRRRTSSTSWFGMRSSSSNFRWRWQPLMHIKAGIVGWLCGQRSLL